MRIMGVTADRIVRVRLSEYVIRRLGDNVRRVARRLSEDVGNCLGENVRGVGDRLREDVGSVSGMGVRLRPARLLGRVEVSIGCLLPNEELSFGYPTPCAKAKQRCRTSGSRSDKHGADRPAQGHIRPAGVRMLPRSTEERGRFPLGVAYCHCRIALSYSAIIATHEEMNARPSRPWWISRGMLAMASMFTSAMLNSQGLARTRAAMCGT